MAAPLVFVAHPGAGRSAFARHWPAFDAALRARGIAHDVRVTSRAGEATELAAAAARDDARLVVAVGGDGTLHEVVDGLLANADGIPSHLAIGLVPAGRGSDYARTLRLTEADSAGLVERFARWLDGDGSTVRSVDAGEVTYRPAAIVAGRPAESASPGRTAVRRFVNAAGIGFSPFVAQRTRRFPDRLGPYLYTAAGLMTILDWRERHVRLRWDDAGEEERAIESVEVALGRYEGGGMLVAPGADPSDGLFDVVVLDALSRAELFTFAWRVRSGDHLSSPRVAVRRAATLAVDAVDERGPIYLQADGELLGRDPFRFRILPSALRVVC